MQGVISFKNVIAARYMFLDLRQRVKHAADIKIIKLRNSSVH